MPSKLIAGALVASGICIPVQSSAGPTTEAHSRLEEVVVSAHPSNASDKHLAQPIIVLKGAELQKKLASTIGETLSREPGVSSTAFGAGASRPVIRGLSGSRVRLLEGGVSSMDVSNLSPDHAVSIEPLAATQIEVIKGPATLLYGSGAIGGVVNVVTNRIHSELP
ncbi:MAG: iron complex outermembrane receptor protein, partial [Gammaproteobacteria bacterium]